MGERRAVVVGRRQVRPGLLQNGTSQGRIVFVRLGVSQVSKISSWLMNSSARGRAHVVAFS